MTDPVASIIIPAKNEASHIRACLDAIFSQDVDAPFEVILIDSGSTDGTPDIVAGYDVRLHQIRPEDFGHGRTRNLGARMSLAPVLVFLNADAAPTHSGWLRGLISELEPPKVAGAYGRQIARDDAYPMERFFITLPAQVQFKANMIVFSFDRRKRALFCLLWTADVLHILFFYLHF